MPRPNGLRPGHVAGPREGEPRGPRADAAGRWARVSASGLKAARGGPSWRHSACGVLAGSAGRRRAHCFAGLAQSSSAAPRPREAAWPCATAGSALCSLRAEDGAALRPREERGARGRAVRASRSSLRASPARRGQASAPRPPRSATTPAPPPRAQWLRQVFTTGGARRLGRFPRLHALGRLRPGAKDAQRPRGHAPRLGAAARGAAETARGSAAPAGSAHRLSAGGGRRRRPGGRARAPRARRAGGGGAGRPGRRGRGGAGRGLARVPIKASTSNVSERPAAERRRPPQSARDRGAGRSRERGACEHRAEEQRRPRPAGQRPPRPAGPPARSPRRGHVLPAAGLPAVPGRPGAGRLHRRAPGCPGGGRRRRSLVGPARGGGAGRGRGRGHLGAGYVRGGRAVRGRAQLQRLPALRRRPQPLLPDGLAVRTQGQPRGAPSHLRSPHGPSLLPLWPVPVRGPREAQERHAREYQHAEGLAERAPQEPLPHQGREDHAGHHHQDDPHAGLHLVRQRAPAPQEGEQGDVGGAQQGPGGRCPFRQRHGGRPREGRGRRGDRPGEHRHRQDRRARRGPEQRGRRGQGRGAAPARSPQRPGPGAGLAAGGAGRAQAPRLAPGPGQGARRARQHAAAEPGRLGRRPAGHTAQQAEDLVAGGDGHEPRRRAQGVPASSRGPPRSSRAPHGRAAAAPRLSAQPRTVHLPHRQVLQLDQRRVPRAGLAAEHALLPGRRGAPRRAPRAAPARAAAATAAGRRHPRATPRGQGLGPRQPCAPRERPGPQAGLAGAAAPVALPAGARQLAGPAGGDAADPGCAPVGLIGAALTSRGEGRRWGGREGAGSNYDKY